MLLTDATSPVTGFEHYQTDFMADARPGMRTSTAGADNAEEGIMPLLDHNIFQSMVRAMDFPRRA